MSYVDPASITRKTVLYVGGLDEQVTERELEGAFRPFGDLVQVVLPKDATTSNNRNDTATKHQAHRGFGFVEFESADDAQEAMENLDDGQLFGRVLKVKLAKPNAIQSQAVWATETGNGNSTADRPTAGMDTQADVARTAAQTG